MKKQIIMGHILYIYIWGWWAHHSFLVTMFICTIRYLLRDSTAISQCNCAIPCLDSFLRVSANPKILMDYYLHDGLLAQWTILIDRYISNPIWRLVLFLTRMLLWINSVTMLRIDPIIHNTRQCQTSFQNKGFLMNYIETLHTVPNVQYNN